VAAGVDGHSVSGADDRPSAAAACATADKRSYVSSVGVAIGAWGDVSCGAVLVSALYLDLARRRVQSAAVPSL